MFSDYTLYGDGHLQRVTGYARTLHGLFVQCISQVR